MKAGVVSLLLAVLLPGAVAGSDFRGSFDDPVLQARYQTLVQDLRCTVCRNQNLLESNSGLARDLRRVIVEQLGDGASDAEIKGFMVDRYGEFVLYRPPLGTRTLVLWLAPGLMLAGGLLFLLLRLRRHSRHAELPPLTSAEQARVERLMKDDEGGAG